MRYFPQLSTGAAGQFPIRKRCLARTVRNVCRDGREIKLADAGESRIEWRLRYAELTDEELAAIEQFFAGVEGRLQTFTFLDPTANLLAWSEKLDEAAWQRDALLLLSSGITDPFGTTRGFQIHNPSAAPLRIQQTLSVPGWFWYSLSLQARSGIVRLFRGGESREFSAGAAWERLVFSCKTETTDESVAFGLEVPAGGTVEVFGVQVEAQTGASAYKKTLSRGGVYAGARLREDGLAVTTVGPGRHACVVAIDANNL